MNEDTNSECSKKIDYLSLLNWSENDTKIFSGVLNKLVEKVSQQVDSIENVVLCSQDDQLFELSSVSEIVSEKTASVHSVRDFDDMSSETINMAARRKKRPLVFSESSVSELSIHELPVEEDVSEDVISDEEFNMLLEKVKTIDSTNPSDLKKLDKLHQCIEKTKRNSTYAGEPSSISKVSSAKNTLQSVEAETERTLSSSLPITTSQIATPQFEPWDELFKTIRSKSMASNRENTTIPNLESHMVSDTECLPSIYREMDSSSENNMLLIDSNESSYEDQPDEYEKKKKAPSRYINLVIELKNDLGGSQTNQKSLRSEKKKIKLGEKDNKISLSLSTEVPQNPVPEKKKRGRPRKVANIPTVNVTVRATEHKVRKSARVPKKNKFFGDFESTCDSSVESSPQSSPRHSETNSESDENRSLIDMFLGKGYKSPIVEIEELVPSFITAFQRLSDVLL